MTTKSNFLGRGEIDPDYLFNKLAQRLSPSLKKQADLTPAERWKIRFESFVDYQDFGKIKDNAGWLAAKIELYKELESVPGEGRYIPGDTQWLAHFAASESRTIQVVGGWRAGKSKWLAAELLPYLFLDDAFVWNVASTYDLAREEFKYIHQWLDYLQADFRVAQPESGKWSIKTAWNSVLQTQTADDVKRLEAANLNAVGIAEAGQILDDVITRLRGRILQKEGPLLLSGSFEGSLPWYLDAFENNINGNRLWRSFSIPSWENQVVFPGGREDPLIIEQELLMAKTDPTGNQFLLKIAAQPVKPPELVFPMFDPKIHQVDIVWASHDKEGGVIDVPLPSYNNYTLVGNHPVGSYPTGWILPDGRPVEISVDPGYAGAYAVLALQKFDGLVFVIDEVYLKETVAEDVITECKQRWWWPRVVGGVIDKAAIQHQGQKSHHEIWAQVGNLYLRYQYMKVMDSTQRLRTMLIDPMTKTPRVYFAAGHTDKTAKEFSLYRYKPAAANRPEREEPIDRDNHCVVGDTMIDMPGGKRKIAELVGEEPWVYCSINGRVAVRQAYDIHKTQENVEVVKVVMDRSELICTPDHLVMLPSGVYVEAGKLRPGQSVMALNRFVTNEGYTRICMTGQTKTTQAEHRLVYEEVHSPIPYGYHIDHIDQQRWNNHPDNLRAMSMEDHASRHHKGKMISIEHRRATSEFHKKRWAEDDGRWLAIARENAKAAHEGNRRKGERIRAVGANHRVIAVVPAGRADVYDMNVHEAHNFVANDIVIHNSIKALSYYMVDRFGFVTNGERKTKVVKYIKQDPEWHTREQGGWGGI